MKPYCKCIISSIFCLLFFSPGFAQIPQEAKDEIQNRVSLEINPSITLAIHDSLGDHYFVSGYSDRDRRVKASTKTLYRLGSLGNTLTGILTAKLSSSGIIEKDTTLGSLVTPALPLKDLRGRSISILDVITHYSGLSDQKGIAITPEANWDVLYEEGIPERISPYRSGEDFLYSDWAIALLANGLAEFTKTPYAQLVHREVLTPSGIPMTYLAEKVNKPGLASGYSPNTDKKSPLPLSAPTLGWAANTEALLKYGKKILTPVPEMQGAIKIATQTYRFNPEGISTAMGWFTDPKGNLYQAGYYKGFNTFMAIDIKNKRIIVLATNTDAADITDIGLHLLNPEHTSLQRFIPQAITPTLLQAYEGVYINDAMGTSLRLEIQQDSLKVVQSEDTLSLHFMGNHRFFYKGLKAHLEFENNENGQVVGVTLNKNGSQMMFIKTE